MTAVSSRSSSESSAVSEDSADAVASEEDVILFKTLLESTRAIPWKIDWASGCFVYIGPQIEELLGWRADSWETVEDWAARIHAEDRQRTVDFCLAQSQSGLDHEADYRALTADGDYVWIRDVVHILRDETGGVEALVGFMFDITERKRSEQQLEALRRELETLSYQDSLTGIANRRMLDQTLGMEWQQAMRTRQPLSLLLIDLDHFKEYNDHFGHPQGDACLRQVAALLSSAVRRARDFCARYGGEEFAILLPETEAEDARAVAERCRELLARAQVAHPASPMGDCLTLSIGVQTLIPQHGDEPEYIVRGADHLLYRAKSMGRNSIVAETDASTGAS